MSAHEKRASERFDVELDMELTRNGEVIAVQVVNLSQGGALIKGSFDPPLRVGERVEVSFFVPDLHESLNATAQVRWVGHAADAIGIQFVTGFRAKETWALGRFLEQQSPA